MYYVTVRKRYGKASLYYHESTGPEDGWGGFNRWGDCRATPYWSIGEANAKLEELRQSYGSIPGWAYPVFEVGYR